MNFDHLPDLRDLLPGLRSRADRYDISGDWPAEELRSLEGVGAMRWAAPLAFGGEDLSAIEIHCRYEAIASASVTVSLILSQRDSAVNMIDAGQSDALREELLPRLARNEIFATVGIAQLTTSRQRGAPALVAEPTDAGFLLRGVIPWCTGADRAQYIVAGAALPDGSGRQILFALPTDLPGVQIDAPMSLVALRASHTSSVRLDDVQLNRRFLLRGPIENVLSMRKRVLPIGQAFLALGLACGAIRLIGEHESGRARALVERFEPQFARLRKQVLDLCAPGAKPEPGTAARLRGLCNEFTLRTTHAAVALYKGTALLADHPAQRMAREAMFLLVWSCPDPVIDCTVDLLSGA